MISLFFKIQDIFLCLQTIFKEHLAYFCSFFVVQINYNLTRECLIFSSDLVQCQALLVRASKSKSKVSICKMPVAQNILQIFPHYLEIFVFENVCIYLNGYYCMFMHVCGRITISHDYIGSISKSNPKYVRNYWCETLELCASVA